MIKIAAFIIPKKKMRLKILNLKKKVKINFGNQPYLSHPPHCTLFTINTSNKLLKERKHFKSIRMQSNYKKSLIIKNIEIDHNSTNPDVP